jgi:hypothetical protein
MFTSCQGMPGNTAVSKKPTFHSSLRSDLHCLSCDADVQAFTTGHSNGTVALHSTQSSASVAVWPELGEGAIQAVAWSPTRPLSFLALDAACTVYVFDMTQVGCATY